MICASLMISLKVNNKTLAFHFFHFVVTMNVNGSCEFLHKTKHSCKLSLVPEASRIQSASETRLFCGFMKHANQTIAHMLVLCILTNSVYTMFYLTAQLVCAIALVIGKGAKTKKPSLTIRQNFLFCTYTKSDKSDLSSS